MTKFIVLTLSGKTRDKNIYLNVDQVQFLRPIEETGNTQIVFDEEHWVLVNEGTEQILKLARAIECDVRRWISRSTPKADYRE